MLETPRREPEPPIDRSDLPRDRLLRIGAKALSDVELVAVLLRTGVRGSSVLEMAREVLEENGGLAGLVEVSASSLVRRGRRRCSPRSSSGDASPAPASRGGGFSSALTPWPIISVCAMVAATRR